MLIESSHDHSQSLCRRIAKVPFHDQLPHDDCEQRKLQCSQDDAEIEACSENDCIIDELGRCSKVLIATDSAGVAVRMDEFALSASSRESAFNSSPHVSVFNCCSALDAIIVTRSSVTVFDTVFICHLFPAVLEKSC